MSSFGYYSFTDRASINKRDTIIAGAGNDQITANNGADFVNLSGGGANNVNMNATNSVQATGSAITPIAIGGLIPAAPGVAGIPTAPRWFAAGSTVTFGNGVDVITGVTPGGFDADRLAPGPGVLVDGTTTFLTLGDTVTRTGGFATAAVNGSVLDRLWVNQVGVPAPVIAAGNTAFAGQLIGTAGANAIAGATYYVQGSYTNGVFTAGNSANFNPATGAIARNNAELGANNDFLVFTIDSAADVNSFNISQPGTPNSFFQNTQSAFVIQDFSFTQI